MNDYTKPYVGNGGNFGITDRAGRELDPAGKLKKQTARRDLQNKGHVDVKRRPIFKQM